MGDSKSGQIRSLLDVTEAVYGRQWTAGSGRSGSQPLIFEAGWVRLGCILRQSGPTSIVALSQQLGVSHPAVLQIAKRMIAEGTLADFRDRRDKRRRLLALTSHGRYVFQGIFAHQQLYEQLVFERLAPADLLRVLSKWEDMLNSEALVDKALKRISVIDIYPYSPEFKPDFELLNRHWIEQYFSIEPKDAAQFKDPEATIIKPGGKILFAVTQTGVTVGACALIHIDDSCAELAKMAVQEDFQGFGIGRQIAEAIIAEARAAGYQEIVLESNTQLHPAIGLYKALGFETTSTGESSDYARGNIKMRKFLR